MRKEVANAKMAAANARAKAIERLQQAHPEEWEQLYGDAREEEGLDRTPTPKALAEENRRLRYRIAELERRL